MAVPFGTVTVFGPSGPQSVTPAMRRRSGRGGYTYDPKAAARAKAYAAATAEQKKVTDEIARKQAEEIARKAKVQRLIAAKATQEKITAGTIGGQVSLVPKKVSPAKYVYQTLVTSGLPIKEKVKRVFDPAAYIKSPYEKEREYEREAKVQADVLEFGKPEYFGGTSLRTLLPYQKRGTAEITTEPFTEEEIARTKYYKGAPIILGKRAQKEAEIISFGAEQEAKGVIGKYQKEVDVLGADIQKEIREGLSYEEGVVKYERETKKLQEEAQKEYEKTYLFGFACKYKSNRQHIWNKGRLKKRNSLLCEKWACI